MRWLAREHFIDDASKRIDIATRVELPVGCGLFRTHVLWSAEGEPRLGQSLSTCHGDRSGNPEVGDHGVTRLEENVFRFDISVDDALTVGIGERVRNFTANMNGLLEPELRFAVQQVSQRLPFHIGHDVEQHPVGFAGVMYG